MENTNDKVHVNAYVKKDGTDVNSYWRAYPGNGQQKDYTNTEFMNLQEGILNLGINIGGKILTPLAYQNYYNAIYNLRAARNDQNAIVFDQLTDINNQPLKKVIKQLNIPDSSKAVFYKPESQYSEQLASSEDIIHFIKLNYSKLKNKYYQNDTVEIDFSKRDFSTWDNYFGIQHGTLFNPHINEKGYFSAILIDYYDFVKRDGKGFSVLLNNHGYALQNKNLLENYAILYYIYTNNY